MEIEGKVSDIVVDAPDLVTPTFQVPENTITFGFAGGEILRLDEKGMTYKGQFIEDAGEAHKAFIETMNILKNRTWGSSD